MRLTPPSRSAQACVAEASRKARSSGGGSDNAACAPAIISSPHAGCQRIITASGNDGRSDRVASARKSDPNTPCTSRRGPPSTSGSAVAIAAWAGVPSRNICASASRNTMRALASSGSGCLVLLSINWSRSTDQRSVSCAMAMASARSGGESPLVAFAVA